MIHPRQKPTGFARYLRIPLNLKIGHEAIADSPVCNAILSALERDHASWCTDFSRPPQNKNPQHPITPTRLPARSTPERNPLITLANDKSLTYPAASRLLSFNSASNIIFAFKLNLGLGDPATLQAKRRQRARTAGPFETAFSR